MKQSLGRRTIMKLIHKEPRDEHGNRKMYKVTAELQITIDLDSVAADMGSKAIRSKSGKSRALYGGIEVRVVNRTEEVCQ